MDLGFETIGNATLIAHDRGPVLATDPWLFGPAYFGSWGLSHPVPKEQQAEVEACRFLWISHGHPDHLSPPCLERLRDKEILLPDHYGGRIARDLRADGYSVRVLPDGEWTPLSDRLRVLSIADIMQDAILLVDLDGNLIVNANDCGDHGVGDFVRSTTARFQETFMACLTGWGDADMINFFSEDGERLIPPAATREPLGPGIGGLMKLYGVNHFLPSSSMHRYQRTDSSWANEYLTPTDVHAEDFPEDAGELLPAFVRYDLVKRSYEAIDPPPAEEILHPPEKFGDNWSDELEDADRKKIAEYLAPVTHLRRFLGYVNFRVGGQDNTFDINREHQLGITFEVPRQSLMTSVEYRVFDDILIGNFARTILHGPWHAQGTAALYPDFGPYLTKYGDNGGAFSASELGRYFEHYRSKGFYRPDPGGPDARAAAPYAP